MSMRVSYYYNTYGYERIIFRIRRGEKIKTSSDAGERSPGVPCQICEGTPEGVLFVLGQASDEALFVLAAPGSSTTSTALCS